MHCRREKLGHRERHAWVERDTALKRWCRGELRASGLRGLKKASIAIDNLNGTLATVLGAPLHIQHSGPEAHGTRKCRSQLGVQGSEADAKAHVPGLEQFSMSIARVVMPGPLPRALGGAQPEGNRQSTLLPGVLAQ